MFFSQFIYTLQKKAPNKLFYGNVPTQYAEKNTIALCEKWAESESERSVSESLSDFGSF